MIWEANNNTWCPTKKKFKVHRINKQAFCIYFDNCALQDALTQNTFVMNCNFKDNEPIGESKVYAHLLDAD